jgi:Rieske Fe-S protein
MSDERLESVAGATSRRALFAGAGAIGASAVLAACGSDGPDGGPGPAAPPGGNGDNGDNGDNGGEQGDGVLTTTGEVEVGGGVILTQQRVVITQPSEGDFRGFSAICTHEGCLVATVNDGTITCPCHGSRFSIEDGSVMQGAIAGQGPLAAVDIEVDGSEIRLA